MKAISEENMNQCQLQCVVSQAIVDLETLYSSFSWDVRHHLIYDYPNLQHLSAGGSWSREIAANGTVNLHNLYLTDRTCKLHTLGSMFTDEGAMQLDRDRVT